MEIRVLAFNVHGGVLLFLGIRKLDGGKALLPWGGVETSTKLSRNVGMACIDGGTVWNGGRKDMDGYMTARARTGSQRYNISCLPFSGGLDSESAALSFR